MITKDKLIQSISDFIEDNEIGMVQLRDTSEPSLKECFASESPFIVERGKKEITIKIQLL